MGLQEAGAQVISKYSKGMLQRLGLAQALLNDPELLSQVGTMEELSAAKGYRIVVWDIPAGAIAALSATAVRLTLDQGEAAIECDDDAMRRHVEQVLKECGAEVERVDIEQQSLEEIFFGAIEKKPS